MDSIGIITEETADLLPEIVEEHQIATVPVILNWPEIEKLPGDNTFQKMRELESRGIKSFGKTSQPSPKDFLAKYLYQIERFDKVLCITLTDKGREALNRAMPVAKEIVDHVMLSIDEGDAALLEKYLRTLRQNAYDGLGNVAKYSQPRRV